MRQLILDRIRFRLDLFRSAVNGCICSMAAKCMGDIDLAPGTHQLADPAGSVRTCTYGPDRESDVHGGDARAVCYRLRVSRRVPRHRLSECVSMYPCPYREMPPLSLSAANQSSAMHMAILCRTASWSPRDVGGGRAVEGLLVGVVAAVLNIAFHEAIPKRIKAGVIGTAQAPKKPPPGKARSARLNFAPQIETVSPPSQCRPRSPSAQSVAQSPLSRLQRVRTPSRCPLTIAGLPIRRMQGMLFVTKGQEMCCRLKPWRRAP